MGAYLPTLEPWTKSECWRERKKYLTRGHFVVWICRAMMLYSYVRFCFSDLMWSDPDDVDNWAVSPRGAGWLFGGTVTQEVTIALLLLLHTGLTRIFP